MNKSNMSKKEIVLSMLTTFICHCGLMVVMFCLLLILYGGDVTPIFTTHSKNVFTVAVASALFTMIVYSYFFIERKEVLTQYSKIVEIYLIMSVSLLICGVIGNYVSLTARPLLLFPLLACMFLRRREAIFMNTAFMLIQFVFNRYLNGVEIVDGSVRIIDGLAALLVQFCGGIMAIFLMKNIKTRLGCVLVGLVLMIPVTIINLIMQIPALETFDWTEALLIAMYGVFDCVLSVLAFMALLPVFEGIFSELTAFKLRELTSDSSKLIRVMKQQALGTYNHSLVVAQLAEACAIAIGEDGELARAAAYYHDVGKLKSPEMFAENQSEYDLHRELTPELSVDIIRSHAREGAKLIKKYRLPEFFADVAVQHHGTMPIKYFFAKALKMSDGELNAGNYSYAGPVPNSKIAAIIMICDASEAAARSLSDRSPEKVATLVSSLVEERMNMEQFVDCDITMRELTIITRTVINQLSGVYHMRVKYPKLVLSRK
ncbi:MAG: HDIG domain-containing protein [Clostridia bacterium]|nr:HDIG domain-containing protein [Clostridia bacterium]